MLAIYYSFQDSTGKLEASLGQRINEKDLVSPYTSVVRESSVVSMSSGTMKWEGLDKAAEIGESSSKTGQNSRRGSRLQRNIRREIREVLGILTTISYVMGVEARGRGNPRGTSFSLFSSRRER